jgi:ABC-type Zn uptake system ZnuABC Zn-binding protein ZnuA
LFDEFRQSAKKMIKGKGLTYAQIAKSSKDLQESTIKCFMCGANDSRRVAEKIADALGMELLYSNGVYKLKKRGE